MFCRGLRVGKGWYELCAWCLRVRGCSQLAVTFGEIYRPHFLGSRAAVTSHHFTLATCQIMRKLLSFTPMPTNSPWPEEPRIVTTYYHHVWPCDSLKAACYTRPAALPYQTNAKAPTHLKPGRGMICHLRYL